MLQLSRCCSEFSVGSFSLEAEQEHLHSLWHVVPGEKARTPYRHANRVDVRLWSGLRTPVEDVRSLLNDADLLPLGDALAHAHGGRDGQVGGPDRAPAHLVPDRYDAAAPDLTGKSDSAGGAGIHGRATGIGEGHAAPAGQPVAIRRSERRRDGNGGERWPLPARLRCVGSCRSGHQHHRAAEQADGDRVGQSRAGRTRGNHRSTVHPQPASPRAAIEGLWTTRDTNEPLWIATRDARGCARTHEPAQASSSDVKVSTLTLSPSQEMRGW